MQIQPVTHYPSVEPVEMKSIEEKIIELVATHFRMPKESLIRNFGHSTDNEQAYKQRIAFYMVRAYTFLSYERVGALFGGKPHSAIRTGCINVENLLEYNDRCKVDVRQIRKQVDNFIEQTR
jgi:chromosomal replication initiation ATPase DnaA